MGYLGVIAIVFSTIWLCFLLLLLHFGVFALIGLFRRKTYPHSERQLKYGIIIAARNEEAVIGDLLQSIRSCDYPQELLRVFVVAHNCSDRTAEIARGFGAEVCVYDNPTERTAGYAYRRLFDWIREQGKDEGIDGYFVINADNVLTPAYISRMNDAFVAEGQNQVITSYRNSRNFGENYMSCLYGIFFISACRFEARGRTVCGCSTRVSGTGYVFPAELVRDGWPYVTLTEDWEFSADQISRGRKILYCDEAEFFDEQPTTIPMMFRQRLRWACGHMTVFFTRFRALLRAIFSPKSQLSAKCRFSAFDIATAIMPLGVISMALLLATLTAIALCPLFGYAPGPVWAFYGKLTLLLFLLSYIITVAFAGVLLLLERRRIPKLKSGTLILALALWPFFLLINVFLDIAALFLPNLEWKVIPHTGRQHPERSARSDQGEGKGSATVPEARISN